MPAVVTIEQLRAVAEQAPKQTAQRPQHGKVFDVADWIARSGLRVSHEGPWNGSGHKWILDSCPMNPDHNGAGKAYVVRLPGGAIEAGCQAASCRARGWGWTELKAQIEPARKPTPYLASLAGVKAKFPNPPSKEAYAGLAGDFVRLVGPHTESDPVALLFQFLAGFGSLVGRAPYFVADGAYHYANLYGVQVGDTSKGRKGTSWRWTYRGMELVDPEWATHRVMGGLSSGEGVIWAVRDPIWKLKQKKGGEPETVLDDEGVSDKRLFILESEFASVLSMIKREGNTLSPTIRDGWDTGNLRTLTKNTPAKSTGAHISMSAHVTREELLRNLDRTEMANGFANRFQWYSVRRSKLLPDGGNLDEGALAALAEKVKGAVAFARSVGEVKRTSRARDAWHEVYPALSADRPGLIGAVLGRAEAQVVRLSLVYALLAQSRVIDLEHLESALALWEYSEASVQYIFGDTIGDPVADRILEALRMAPHGLRRWDDIHETLFSRHQGTAVDRALRTLMDMGLARVEKEETGGRPAERFFATSGEVSEESEER